MTVKTKTKKKLEKKNALKKENHAAENNAAKAYLKQEKKNLCHSGKAADKKANAETKEADKK